MHIQRLRASALAAAVTSVIVASLVSVASPASAAELIPANEINGGSYTVKLTPTERAGYAAGSASLAYGPDTVEVSTGCPEGYRASSRTFVVNASGTETSASSRRTSGDIYGLTGGPITLTGARAASWVLLNETTFPTGINKLVITCDGPVALQPSAPIGNSKYFVTYLEVDRAADSWKVVAKPTQPVEKTATTTTLAASGTTENSTTLTATVSPTAATGTVQFTQNGVNVGSPAVVTNGTASYSVSNLAPATAYQFGAVYSGDTTHETSTGTTPVTTLTPVPPVDNAETEIGVEVPPAGVVPPTGLKISTKPATAITLAGADARKEGEAWTATGQLGNVTVTDDRQKDAAASGTTWTLSGSASSFKAGTAELAASNLSWTPAEVGDGLGSAGSAATGLVAAKVLATGPATATKNAATTVKAGLSLTVPAGTAPGNYKSTLTLTLV